MASSASDLLRGKEIPTSLIEAFPKAELHVHLDGSLRPATFLELARAQGQDLANAAAVNALFSGEGGLDAYISLFDHPLSVLQTAAALERCAAELVEDCAAENCLHVEIRFAPSLHAREGLDAEAATEAVLKGMADAAQRTNISAGLIIAAVRHRSPDESLEMARLAVSYAKKGIIGFDLAGVEPHHPAHDHREAFEHIVANNVNCTVHAGEAWGPESIHEAVHLLGAHRISHAIHLLEDPDLANFVADHRIPLELGLSSSLRTASVESIDRHPLRRLLRNGHRCVITSNNRLLLGQRLSDELRLAADSFDLSLLELENLIISSFKSAFIPQGRRKELLRQVIGSFGPLRKEHGVAGESS